MKPVNTLLTILIILLVSSAAVAVGYWSYVIQHWSVWITLSMSMGVFALYFLLLFFKKYFIRRREKKFVQRIVDHGEVLDANAIPEQQAILDLEKSWQYNVGLLKTSHLKKRGNPLFVLPWYLAMGESGVGKSTMLANAGISTSFTELEDQKGQVEPTRTCDWVFFDSSIILDTPGRYSVPPSSNLEQNEWKRFLLLLAKYRRKEPLSGIILFVAADSLTTDSPHVLRKKGQVLRNRIHSLMRTLGFKIPVSVMVTKMDHIPGFSEFAEIITEQDRAQAMGQLNGQTNPYWQELLDKTMANLDKGLQKIRLSEVGRAKGRRASFFSLPSQLQPLKEGLKPFLDALFSENSYQETPVIKGIFLGSGRCSKSPLPGFLTPAAGSESNNPLRHASVFAKDFFTSVLPSNRWNIEPVKELLLWRRITRNLAIITWLCLVAFAAGITGLSYLHNQKVYSLLPTSTNTISHKQPGSNTVIISLEKMRLAILAVEKANKSWKLPFTIFNDSLLAEAAFKKEYCRLFIASLLGPMEKDFENAVKRMDNNTSADLYADYFSYSVEQIIFLKDYLDGKKTPDFNSFEQESSAVLSLTNKDLLSEVGTYFPDLNRSYLAWSKDRTSIEERILRLQKTLQTMLTLNRGEISWLYAQSIADTAAITLADFWKHRQADLTNTVTVPGAFTKKGRLKIEQFLADAERAVLHSGTIKELRRGYLDSYPQQFVHWWKLFAENFQDGELDLQTDSDWREAAILMAAPDNPYFMMLDTMAGELSAFAKDVSLPLPDWGTSVIGINDIRKLALASQKDQNSEKSLVAKVTAEKDKIAEETLQQVDPAKASAMNQKLKMAGAWGKYEDGLVGLKVITPYKEKATAQFSSWFKQVAGASQEQSVFAEVYDSWVALKSLGHSQQNNPLVWQIAYGPVAFLMDFAARDTAQVLQEKWQENVLAVATNVGPDKIPSLLFDKTKGIVWKYLRAYADPFVLKSVNGYKARNVYGRTLVFEPEFYALLNQATMAVIHSRPQYSVKLVTTPIQVNSGATAEPIYANFFMQCADKSFSLKNDNFPRALTIDWSPETCGDVTLKIGFPTMELTRKWSGNLAFAKFIGQFQTGAYTFTKNDFPEDAGHLQDRNIEFISISYLFSGETEVLQLLYKPPAKILETIIVPAKQISAKPLRSSAPAQSFSPPATPAPTGKSDKEPLITFEPKHQYPVKLVTVPIEANSSARVEPTYARFSMQCANKQFTLENDNFPRELTVNWSPEICGDVTLTIGFPTMKLTRKWPGNMAFADFLAQFKGGSYKFTKEDFPADKKVLEDRKIDYINISYRLTGETEILGLLPGKPLTKAQPIPPYHDSQWLLEQSPQAFTVQIMSIRAGDMIESGFSLVSGRTDNGVYSKTIKGINWYVLCSGIFPTAALAGEYIDSLPPALQKAGPVIRPIIDIQNEIGQTTNNTTQ